MLCCNCIHDLNVCTKKNKSFIYAKAKDKKKLCDQKEKQEEKEVTYLDMLISISRVECCVLFNIRCITETANCNRLSLKWTRVKVKLLQVNFITDLQKIIAVSFLFLYCLAASIISIAFNSFIQRNMLLQWIHGDSAVAAIDAKVHGNDHKTMRMSVRACVRAWCDVKMKSLKCDVCLVSFIGCNV